MEKSYIPQYAKLLLLTLFLILGIGCTNKEAEKLNVTTKSEIFLGIAKAMDQACNNPAEFGRCDECTIDGLRSSCAIANRCLENGFCELAKQ